MKQKSHTRKKMGVACMIMIIFVTIALLFTGVYLYKKYRPMPTMEDYYVEIEYLGEAHIDSYDSYFNNERLLRDFDINNFSFSYIIDGPISPDGFGDVPYIDLSMYNIDFDTEIVVCAVNRKLQSLMVDGDSIYYGMAQMDAFGRRIPEPPFFVATLENEYFPNTLFIYSIPKIEFRRYDSPDMYNEWNRIAE